MHHHHARPIELNQERVAALMAKRKGWSEGEDVELMAQASSLWERGMPKKDLYAHLHSLCPHRSLDSIKKRLQTSQMGTTQSLSRERTTSSAGWTAHLWNSRV